MKKKLFVFIIPVLFIFLTGCPYASDYPIDKPSVKVDIGLLGKWEDATGNTSFVGDKPVYVVTKKSTFIYGISTTSYVQNSSTNGLEENTTVYEGHISLVNDIEFINIKQISPESDNKYFIYKLEVSGNNCILSELSSTIDKTFSSSAELKAFILKNLENELLFSGSQTLFRN